MVVPAADVHALLFYGSALGRAHRFLWIMQVLHERCKGVGMEEFICKPFRVEDLQRIVKHTRRVSSQVPTVSLLDPPTGRPCALDST